MSSNQPHQASHNYRLWQSNRGNRRSTTKRLAYYPASYRRRTSINKKTLPKGEYTSMCSGLSRARHLRQCTLNKRTFKKRPFHRYRSSFRKRWKFIRKRYESVRLRTESRPFLGLHAYSILANLRAFLNRSGCSKRTRRPHLGLHNP